MFRAISLMVVLAHLGVAMAPPCEAKLGPERLPMLAMTDDQSMHHAFAPPVEEETRPAGHAHHQHAHHQNSDHADDSSHAAAQAPAEVALSTATRVIRAAFRAVCLCGCSTNTNSPGTTTSPRLGFALFPPAPPRLGEPEPSVDVQWATPVPAPLPDALDHVPILFS
jgi:hypothetical protein